MVAGKEEEKEEEEEEEEEEEADVVFGWRFSIQVRKSPREFRSSKEFESLHFFWESLLLDASLRGGEWNTFFSRN